MHVVEEKAEIARPRGEIWSLLVNFDEAARYLPADLKCALIGGGDGEGTALKVERDVDGQLLECIAEVVEWEPESLLSLISIEQSLGGKALDGFENLRLKVTLDENAGKTAVALVASWESEGFLKGIASRTGLAKQVRDDLRGILDRLA